MIFRGIAALVVLLASPPGEPIGPTRRHRVGPISFELPVAWRESSRAEGTVQIDSASGDAYLLVDASRVEAPGLTPDTCLDIILKRLPGSTWKKSQAATFAIARDTSIERSPDTTNQAGTQRIVGCDGKYSWSIVIYAKLAAFTHYARVGQGLVESLRAEAPRLDEKGNLLLVDETNVP